MPNYNGVWSLSTHMQYVTSLGQGIAATVGIFAGGNVAGSRSNVISFIDVATTGNATDFGDLTVARQHVGSGAASAIRAIVPPGDVSPYTVLDYFNLSSKGNAVDFGDVSVARSHTAALASSTRGVFCGGRDNGAEAGLNTLDYITIASTGNATDFGDLGTGSAGAAKQKVSTCGSPTRGLIWMGARAGTAVKANQDPDNYLEYITIASTGNATDFGTGLYRGSSAAVSSATRAVNGGGNTSGTDSNVLEYVTIASTGDTTDFGDLASATTELAAVCSRIRGVFGGGTVSGTAINVLQYITIASTGNATDFGDLAAISKEFCGVSDGHGGL